MKTRVIRAVIILKIIDIKFNVNSIFRLQEEYKYPVLQRGSEIWMLPDFELFEKGELANGSKFQ